MAWTVEKEGRPSVEGAEMRRGKGNRRCVFQGFDNSFGYEFQNLCFLLVSKFTANMFSTVVLEGASSSSLTCDGNAVCVERERFAVDAAFEADTEQVILDRSGLDFGECPRRSQQSPPAARWPAPTCCSAAWPARPARRPRVQLGQPGLLQRVGRLANAHGAGTRQFRLRVSVLSCAASGSTICSPSKL